jgi:hypothetical protein
MSPTSYQAAPPRTITITDAPTSVKLRILRFFSGSSQPRAHHEL